MRLVLGSIRPVLGSTRLVLGSMRLVLGSMRLVLGSMRLVFGTHYEEEEWEAVEPVMLSVERVPYAPFLRRTNHYITLHHSQH